MSQTRPLWQKISVPIGLAVGFAILLGLSNHHVDTPEGIPVILDQDAYGQTVQKARALSQPILDAYEQGVEPTDNQRKDLRKAALLYDAANRFDPLAMENYFCAGWAYQILGDYETADERLRQLIYNKIYNENSAGEDTVIEAKNLLSNVRGLEGNWVDALGLANDAVKKHPESAIYHTTRASAELQLKMIDDAQKDLAIAHTIDPTYKRAIQLESLITAGKSKAPG